MKRQRKPGGGRKKGEPTTVVRIPVSVISKVNRVVETRQHICERTIQHKYKEQTTTFYDNEECYHPAKYLIEYDGVRNRKKEYVCTFHLSSIKKRSDNLKKKGIDIGLIVKELNGG